MTTESVISCSFSSWYEKFKKYTVKSRILKIPKDVVDYLNADGIILPGGSHGINSRTGTEWDSDDEDLKEDWGKEDVPPSTKVPSFPEFDEQIRDAISALGGSVFPKLNWSSPKDATWIALNNSLECKTPADVYLLLKSSTFVAHDLTKPFQTGDSEEAEAASYPTFEYELVLRRWHNLNPAGEFRCFVKNEELTAICQRNYKNFYEHIKKEEDKIPKNIAEFYSSVIKGNFPVSNYVFDVYRNEQGKVYLLDFNPYCPVTDGLLFSWDELDQINPASEKSPEFRIVESETGITSSPYQNCAMPQDFIDLSTGMDPDKLIDFLKMKIQTQEEDSSDDEEVTSDTCPAPLPKT